MKISITNRLYFDKTLIVLTVAALAAAIFIVMSFIYAGNTERKNSQLNAQLADIQSIAGKIVRIRTIVGSKEKKIGLKKSMGVVSTLEQVLNGLGLEAQVIRPLDKTRINEFIEENAELEIQNTDLNSIVNLLYKIDRSPFPMKIKNAAIETTFQDPDKFILKLTISLMSRA
jgi:hypothetical protein